MTKKVWDSIKSIGSTLVFVWVFTHGVAQATVVPTESMTPTILVGDHFFLDKLAFPANYPGVVQKYLPNRTIHRGEIMAFWSPETPDLRLVKRVIGLPGETLEVRHRDVYINGQKLTEPYANHTDPVEFDRRDNYGPVTLGPDQFFMMGDNRDNSNDSRFWGPAPRQNFIGRPLFVYWSYDDVPQTHQFTTTEWVEHTASVAAHFLTRTRWTRTGTIFHE